MWKPYPSISFFFYFFLFLFRYFSCSLFLAWLYYIIAQSATACQQTAQAKCRNEYVKHIVNENKSERLSSKHLLHFVFCPPHSHCVCFISFLMGPQLVASFVYTSDSSSVLSAARTAFFSVRSVCRMCYPLWDGEYHSEDVSFFKELEGGEAEGRSHNFHRHFLIPETLQKTNCVKWEKLQVHIPQWCTPSCLPLSAHILGHASTHTQTEAVRGGWGVEVDPFSLR